MDANQNSNFNNNNNNTIDNDFRGGNDETAATTTTTTTPATMDKNLSNTAIHHPLQDIPLSSSNENISEMQQQQQQKVQRKGNWVKFDDEVNEINGNSLNNTIANNSNNNIKNNNSIHNHDQIDSSSAAAAPLAAARTTATTTMLAANKLSTSPTPTGLLPPPPPPSHSSSSSSSTSASSHHHARPRTPLESTSAATHQETTIDINAATPAQRTNQSTLPDVAPAVLTTESTHVNLNASGKAHQQPTPQQRKQQQQQQQPNKPLASSNISQQQTHHSNHQHNQHLQQQHQHNSNNGISTTMSGTHHKMPNSPHVATIPVDAIVTTTTQSSATATAAAAPPMRTIELSTGRIREGFANGDVIVTLLPANTKWPWITPAIFRPELVPEELMAQGLTLTVEEYVQAMETLVNDYRFTVYNICYKRILVCWILFAFTVLLTLLFSGLQGIALFSLGVAWLFLNAAAIFVCMWIKLRLSRGLEKCLARVNRQLMKHKILLILDDRGRISCHKVNLCFMYFDSTQCVNYLNEFLEHTEQNGGEAIKAGWERKLDIDVEDIIIQGNNPVRLSRKQERGAQLVLRYGSRWGMEALRGLVDVTPYDPARHCGQFQCPCQYIKDHLKCKPRVDINDFGQVVWTRKPY